MDATVRTGSLSGVEAHDVRVEVSPVRGLPLPGFDLVGLPEASVRESRVRVTAALRNSGFQLPEQRFAVNLAPADLRKAGSSFDLAIAVALLHSAGLCAPNRLHDTLVLGELSLGGQLRPVRGVLAQLRSARERGLARAIIPAGDAAWGTLLTGMRVHCAERLFDVVAFLNGEGNLPLADTLAVPAPPPSAALDLSDVRGQYTAKRALEVAAAGHHDLLMVGPPGAGKTMLARRLPDLLPAPSPEEQLEIATIASSSGWVNAGVALRGRPFRAPHHSATEAALIGGGVPLRPGEVTLAHHGVLFLDELPEFRRNALESLRPVMESGEVRLVRARERACLPAAPLIVAAMNPCPCGFAGERKRVCRCTPDQVDRYRSRVSGPILDRFDLHVRLPPVDVATLEDGPGGDGSAAVRARVEAARELATQRRARERLGRAAPTPTLEQLSRRLSQPALRLLHRSMDSLGLSLRAYGALLRVSHTLADLAGVDAVDTVQVAEAVQYRLLDRDGRNRSPAHVSC
jgi:magnesium chelatase family protein